MWRVLKKTLARCKKYPSKKSRQMYKHLFLFSDCQKSWRGEIAQSNLIQQISPKNGSDVEGTEKGT